MKDDYVIYLCDGCTEEEYSTHSPSLRERRLAREHRQKNGIVNTCSKWSTQYAILVALSFLFVYRQEALLSSVSSFTGASSEVQEQKEQTEVVSFVMPSRSNMRYLEAVNIPEVSPKKEADRQDEHVDVVSFVMPERSDMRYPEYDNMTATEKVVSEYIALYKSDFDPLANCSVTSQVRIIQKSPQWILQSIDANGNDKTKGGDEFYVIYTDDNRPQYGNHTAVALIKDLENGSYALDFVSTPMDPEPTGLTGMGKLTVHYEYTCGIGHAHQPMKAGWKFGGATLIHHSKSNITQPPIRAFQLPPSDIDLSTFDLVVTFGDSLMQTLVREKDGARTYHRDKTNWHWNPMDELNSATLDYMLAKLEEWHGVRHLRNSKGVALVLGSSAWEITAKDSDRTHPDFSDHLETCRRFVLKVRALYPDVTVMWKAPAAMHLHRLDVKKCQMNARCIKRLPYCSNSRVKYLYEEQMKIMNELNVPVLDVFEASYLSADQHSRQDALHYQTPFNKLIQNSFYKATVDVIDVPVLDVFKASYLSADQLIQNSFHKATVDVINPAFQFAFNQSFGFFDDIPEKRWNDYYRRRARAAEHYRIPNSPNSRMGMTHHWNFFNWDPYFTCPSLEKIGGLGEGAKWICDIDRLATQVERRRQKAKKQSKYDPDAKHCLIYSIGSNGDYKFEDAVVDRLGQLCEIHVFDMGALDRGAENANRGIIFHKWGLASSYSIVNNNEVTQLGNNITTHTFQEIKKLLGHEDRTLDVFKIDCEGCEWTTYKDWINTDTRQILIETHGLPRPKKETITEWGTFPAMRASDYFDAFKQTGFVLFSKEVNSAWAKGECVEWSYLKLDKEFLGDSIARTSKY